MIRDEGLLSTITKQPYCSTPPVGDLEQSPLIHEFQPAVQSSFHRISKYISIYPHMKLNFGFISSSSIPVLQMQCWYVSKCKYTLMTMRYDQNTVAIYAQKVWDIGVEA